MSPAIEQTPMSKLKRSRWIAFASSLLVLPVLVQPAHSQDLYGSLVGNVTDPANAAVAIATVRITQAETNGSREAKTNDTGVHSFPSIPPGTYTVEVTVSGFQKAAQPEIVVRASSSTTSITP